MRLLHDLALARTWLAVGTFLDNEMARRPAHVRNPVVFAIQPEQPAHCAETQQRCPEHRLEVPGPTNRDANQPAGQCDKSDDLELQSRAHRLEPTLRGLIARATAEDPPSLIDSLGGRPTSRTDSTSLSTSSVHHSVGQWHWPPSHSVCTRPCAAASLAASTRIE